MRHFSLVVVAAFLSSFAGIAAAQSSPAQLCVANTQSHGEPSTNTTGRDLLIKFLSKEKDKSVAQDVPIDTSTPEHALQEAKTKNCDYLVLTNQTESHQENGVMTGAFSTTSMPTFYVTTAYTLTKVIDGSALISGNFKASDRGSEQNAIGVTMHKIADKVTEAIKKAGPLTHP